MPYRKRYYPSRGRGRGYYGRKGKRKNYIFYRRLKNKTYWMAKKALALTNPEFKLHNFQQTANTINTSGTIDTISLIAQGDTDTTRDGNSIKITRMHIRGFIKQDAVATQTMIRMMVVLDRQTNGAQFSMSDLIADTTAGDAIVSPLVINNKFRFRVLVDRVYHMSSESSTIIKFNIFRKMGMKMRYSANAAAITSCPSKSIAVVFISDEATNSPTVTYFSRLRYLDN